METLNIKIEGLEERHLRQLMIESGISEDVIRRRGYRTVTDAAELRGLGFAGYQAAKVPGLLIPIHQVDGHIHYLFRPDIPRLGAKDGKLIKYEAASGSHKTLDVHPFIRGLLTDILKPLYVTEGVKKGDAMVSRGLCAIDVDGVWCWRGTLADGSKGTLACWDAIALKGRKAVVVFDSDASLNRQVRNAEASLCRMLTERGANAYRIRLPGG